MNKGKIIVSCTTTSSRIHMLYYMVESIKKQSILPDILYINLSSEPFLDDDGIADVPGWLNYDFININWTENIGPYRKLLPAIEKTNEDDIIITADDDILYSPSWLENLLELKNKYPNHIVCARARDMKKNIFGRWQNYSRWKLIPFAKESMLILPTGGAGTVYRKSFLDLEFLFDPAFKELAPTNDDLWFRMASLRKNVPVYVFPQIDNENIYLTHNYSLYQKNIQRSKSIAPKFIKKFRDKIGIRATKNDYAWSRIKHYNSNYSIRQ